MLSERKFSRDIYNAAAVKKAVFAYSRLARFNIAENKKYITVKVSNIKPEFADIFCDEFANYVLGMTKKCL